MQIVLTDCASAKELGMMFPESISPESTGGNNYPRCNMANVIIVISSIQILRGNKNAKSTQT